MDVFAQRKQLNSWMYPWTIPIHCLANGWLPLKTIAISMSPMDITPKPLTIPLSIFFYNSLGIVDILSRNTWEISAASDASMNSEWEVLATCDDGHINTSPLFPFGQNFPIPAFFEARLLANFFHIAPQSPHKRSSCLLVHPRLSFSFLAVLPTLSKWATFPLRAVSNSSASYLLQLEGWLRLGMFSLLSS